MPLTGVAGWPIDHSRSPSLHQAAFDALGLGDWRSQRLPIPPELFEETVRSLEESGFVGINVTIPHKEAALAVSHEATDAAVSIGAANTLTFREGRIHAANTDSPAIAEALVERLGPVPIGSALVLGAGGSARAAVHALGALGVERIEVWNRTGERAGALVDDLGIGTAVDRVEPAEVLINCTAAGLTGEPAEAFDQIPVVRADLESFSTVVDLVYRTGGGPVGSAAAQAGCEMIDGLEILVRQGAHSISIWTGSVPPLEPLREAVSD